MKIDDIEIEYFIDYIAKRIHLLDLNYTTDNNLPNIIGPEFQMKLVEQEHLLLDVLDFEWVIYASNGLILLYKIYNLQLVGKTEKKLHRPFLDVIAPN